MPNFRALTSLVVLYSKDYAAAIRGKYHESSADCFEHPKKSNLYQATEKTWQIKLGKSNLYQATEKTWQLFLPPPLPPPPTPPKRKKIPGIKKFQTPKNPSIIPVTWNPESWPPLAFYGAPSLSLSLYTFVSSPVNWRPWKGRVPLILNRHYKEIKTECRAGTTAKGWFIISQYFC